ncbi:hypothetical protein PTKIN_Ptkin12aG0216800 [Pterospermum kingtungense]
MAVISSEVMPVCGSLCCFCEYASENSLRIPKVDPSLQLVDDCRLQTAESEIEHPGKVYGSKEDDEDALRSCWQQESSQIKNQLLRDFIPDNGCPCGAHLFMDTPTQAYQSGLIGLEAHLALETQNLQSVDELLNALPVTTSQVRRSSVSTPPNMPYSEMTGHCEALLLEKQQKDSAIPFIDQNVVTVSLNQCAGTSPMLCDGENNMIDGLF